MVAEGPPEAIAASDSYTGRFLRPALGMVPDRDGERSRNGRAGTARRKVKAAARS